jgi:hypothetical protein
MKRHLSRLMNLVVIKSLFFKSLETDCSSDSNLVFPFISEAKSLKLIPLVSSIDLTIPQKVFNLELIMRKLLDNNPVSVLILFKIFVRYYLLLKQLDTA